ncbi:dehydrogenase [Aliidiomarina sedimenti]|uniref:Dehydrogenase n=1 Tax=Aliidiomarina sedimenti TaxID=1933879 RepID=A0ABY0BYD2_9GAMM|nr:YciI family protein [Aliidiomarina sedimenti]RUO29261.1 dehydrogenase [Aliidiomarina sedimenti]
MKYLCLVYANENDLHSLPDSPHDSECHAYASQAAERGTLIAGQALQPVATATTVRVRDGQATVTDGPFAETKEQLAGFYMIEARDLNEAIAFAEKIPPARVGSIEVRPVRELDV